MKTPKQTTDALPDRLQTVLLEMMREGNGATDIVRAWVQAGQWLAGAFSEVDEEGPLHLMADLLAPFVQAWRDRDHEETK
jgi:hypothetical protein